MRALSEAAIPELEEVRESLFDSGMTAEMATISQEDIAEATAALQLPQIADVIKAMAALNHPRVIAALTALQRCSSNKMNEKPRKKKKKAALKPIVVNNLFVICFLWTLLGIFMLFGADRNSVNTPASIALFAIYMIVQVTIIILILYATSFFLHFIFVTFITHRYVTQRQVKKSGITRLITLAFLIQGWTALVYSFAGIFLFFQHAFEIGVLQNDRNVRRHHASHTCAAARS